MLLSAACREYLAETVKLVLDPKKPSEKTLKFLVMFRDGSGDVYLLDKVPPHIQDANKRSKYFRENEILPAITFKIVDGCLSATNHTENATLLNEVQSFLTESNNGLGVAYLLAWDFLTPEFIVAARASQHRVAGAGKLSCNDAARRAQSEYDEFIAQMRSRTAKALGLPTMKSAARLAPATPIAPLPNEVTVDTQGVAVEAGPSKTALIKEAKSLGVPATKTWDEERIKTAIAAKKALDAAEALASAEVPAPTV